MKNWIVALVLGLVSLNSLSMMDEAGGYSEGGKIVNNTKKGITLTVIDPQGMTLIADAFLQPGEAYPLTGQFYNIAKILVKEEGKLKATLDRALNKDMENRMLLKDNSNYNIYTITTGYGNGGKYVIKASSSKY